MKPRSPSGPGIKRETAIVISLATFVLGIMAGVALTIYKLGGPSPAQESVPAAVAPPPRPAGPSPQQEEALRGLEARVNKDPKDVDGWIQLGNLQFDLGRPMEAIEAYDKALALKPDSPDVLTDQGIMYRRIGQPEKAVERFREANRVDPEHFQSLYNLGVVLLHDLNDVPGAIRAWEAYLKVIPQGPKADRIRTIIQRLREGEGSKAQ